MPCCKEFCTSDDRIHICEYCSKGFNKKHYLHAHLTKHCYWNPSSKSYHAFKSKPFSCSRCGAAYLREKTLISHVRYDCGKITQCGNCGKTFQKLNSFRAHWCSAILRRSNNLCDSRH